MILTQDEVLKSRWPDEAKEIIKAQAEEIAKLKQTVEEYREMFDSCLRTGGKRLREIAKLKQELSEKDKEIERMRVLEKAAIWHASVHDNDRDHCGVCRIVVDGREQSTKPADRPA